MVGVECCAGRSPGSQPDLAIGVYRLGTLAENGRRSAIPPSAAQSQPAAMPDPFSLGTVRKGSVDRSAKKKTAL